MESGEHVCIHKCLDGPHVLARHSLGDEAACEQIEADIFQRRLICLQCDEFLVRLFNSTLEKII